MESVQSTSLLGTAKAYWRSLAPAWIFPFAFFYGGGVSDSVGHPELFFAFIALPLFFWSFFRATRPWRSHQIKYWHCVFWVLAVPFLVSLVAVGSRLALLSAGKA